MRFLYFLFLIVFVAVVAVFAYQNNRPETVAFADRSWELSFPIVVGGAYVLGMLSGWSVVGMLRRSLEQVTEHRRA